MNDADFLIVGGGSAGATLAARLSEDPKSRVLLIEAGLDTPPNNVPADIVDTFPSSSFNPKYFWPGLRATRVPGELRQPFPQARVMGGGSSIMGLWALRGMPSDFDNWAQMGAENWAWADVLKYFRKIEWDFDRDRNQRSDSPPYPIRRIPRDQWPAIANAIEAAAISRGLRSIFDINENPGDGFFPMPVSRSDSMRSSSAICYLTSAVRRRANLSIMANTRVIALRFDGLRVCGVTIEQGGEQKIVNAREVILSAGAIYSPAILLRAGIGPAVDLKQLGITPLVDRPGVGKNLQNHCYLNIALTLPRRSRLKANLRHFAIAGIRFSSELPGSSASDLLLFLAGRVSPHSYGTDLAMLGVALYAPYSRGAVYLKSRDYNAQPNVDFSLLQDPGDAPRLLKAARFAESMLIEPRIAATYSDAFLLPPRMMLNQFNRPGLAGSVVAGSAKIVLNSPAILSRWVLNHMLKPGRWFANRYSHSMLSDQEIVSAAVPMGHVSGTCRIGRPNDTMAVVDSTCRVYGLHNLRIIDASVMPTVPRANTNLPTIMIAERAADLIRSGAVH